MAPAQAIDSHFVRRANQTFNGSWRKDIAANSLVLESWGQGCMFGALMIMACVTVANMRKGVLLHKLILLELLLAIMHGTFCFMSFNGYGWYLSSTAALLYCSWFVHNVVAWIKIKPFFVDQRSLFQSDTGKIVGRVYVVTLAMTIPPIILQITCNFLFFNNINDLYTKVRPTEPLFRDPWWIFTCLTLFHVIRKCYGASVLGLIRRSPRLGILLSAIFLAMVFTLMDILAVLIPKMSGSVDGINPYWKLALIFKCLTDNIMLDDFKTELKRLGGGASFEPQTAQQILAPPTVPEKWQDGRVEVENATAPIERPLGHNSDR